MSQGLHANPMFVGIWAGTITIQVVIVTFGGEWFHVRALTLQQWGWCVLFGLGELVWNQVCETFDKQDINKYIDV
jgi:hypothetical protein